VGGGAHAAPPLLYLHSLPSPARPPPDNCQRRGPAPPRYATKLSQSGTACFRARTRDSVMQHGWSSAPPAFHWCAGAPAPFGRTNEQAAAFLRSRRLVHCWRRVRAVVPGRPHLLQRSQSAMPRPLVHLARRRERLGTGPGEPQTSGQPCVCLVSRRRAGVAHVRPRGQGAPSAGLAEPVPGSQGRASQEGRCAAVPAARHL
jgi:hypothetical protein